MPGREWADAVYRDKSLVTRIGPLHADQAERQDRPDGRPTSSSTMPGLVVSVYRHAMIADGMDVLDVGTGSGYGAALLAARLGDARVTTIDIDPHLVKAAEERLARTGHRPLAAVADATGPLPGGYDRIVSMTSVAPIPASWLAALRPGGRLVTTLTGTGLIVTATKTPDGGAAGRTEWERAGFMHARTGPDYAPDLLRVMPGALDGDAGEVTTGRYPVINTERVGAVLHARRHGPRPRAPLRDRPGRETHRLAGSPGRVVGPRHRRRPGTARRAAERSPATVGHRRRDPSRVADRRNPARLRGRGGNQPRRRHPTRQRQVAGRDPGHEHSG